MQIGSKSSEDLVLKFRGIESGTEEVRVCEKVVEVFLRGSIRLLE